ncbi:hypothetical protein FB451DRAFT_1192965 [Mycena latifolia]|nr:hypothetical protein FB451DRAFT_1192965 [Mycena latifolia]
MWLSSTLFLFGTPPSLHQATDGALVASLMPPTGVPDVLWEIAAASDPHTRCQLVLLCSWAQARVCSLLYQHISVGDEAGRLVRTLADKRSLPPMVQSLIFHSSLCAYINKAEWTLMLPAMQNLRHLVVNHHIPLDHLILPLITFRLHTFLSPKLEEIGFHSDLLSFVPGPSKLPMLRSVKGRPEDVARFAWNHHLDSVAVKAVRDLCERTPTLKILMLTCSPTVGRWVPCITVADGANFCTMLVVLSRPLTLRTFHFCSLDGCATWRNWGQDDEEVSYTILDDHGPWDHDPQYA